MDPSCDTTTTCDSDNDTFTRLPIQNLAHGMKLEFKHISDAIKTSLREEPRSYSDNPPDRSVTTIVHPLSITWFRRYVGQPMISSKTHKRRE